MTHKQELLQRAEADYQPNLVAIDDLAIEAVQIPPGTAALATMGLPFEAASWNGQSYPAPAGAVAVIRYLLAMTALQYRFWSIDNLSREFLRYEYGGKVGSTGLAAAFANAWGSSPTMSTALSSACVSGDALTDLFGKGLPGALSRREILHEVLMSPAGQDAVHEVVSHIVIHRRLDVSLAKAIARLLPAAYGDDYLKKAMLFLGFLGGWLQSVDKTSVEVDLCAYADYQVPSVLRYHGILKYSPDVAHSVDTRQLLTSGGPMERAIRSATILACERMAQVHKSTAAGVDWWCFQQRKLPNKPFHLTVTTDY